MRRVAMTIALTGVLLLTGCGGGDDTSTTDEESAPTSGTAATTSAPAVTTAEPTETEEDDGGVDWENYAPAVRRRIDGLAKAKDCAGLQEQFDLAEANNDAQRERTGDGNADLMGYIDEAMSGPADCY